MLLDAVGSAASFDAPAHGADASFTYGWWFSKNACGGNVNTNGYGWEYMVSHCEEDCGNPYEGAPLRFSMTPLPHSAAARGARACARFLEKDKLRSGL